MTYTRNDFGRDLLTELERGFDVVRLSRWAMAIHMKHCRETDPELDKIIMSIVAMEEGPEFEFSEQEVRRLALESHTT